MICDEQVVPSLSFSDVIFTFSAVFMVNVLATTSTIAAVCTYQGWQVEVQVGCSVSSSCTCAFHMSVIPSLRCYHTAVRSERSIPQAYSFAQLIEYLVHFALGF